jgi:hypothetical protein
MCACPNAKAGLQGNPERRAILDCRFRGNDEPPAEILWVIWVRSSASGLNKDMGRLGRPVARPPDGANHPLDKAVAPAQFLELFGGQLQPGALDQNRKALG